MTLVVSIQYVTILMRADNKGQGGSLALVALISRSIGKIATTAGWSVLLGVFATALFYGDSMITPAISVLSAVEGPDGGRPPAGPFRHPHRAGAAGRPVRPAEARHGQGRRAVCAGHDRLFHHHRGARDRCRSSRSPEVLWALNPWYAVQFFITDKWLAFLALGSVVLAVTGSEALYSDMGHFGRGPMRLSWFGFVMPCLLLNYFGQGAMIVGLPAMPAAEGDPQPVLLPGARSLSPAAGDPGHRARPSSPARR